MSSRCNCCCCCRYNYYSLTVVLVVPHYMYVWFIPNPPHPLFLCFVSQHFVVSFSIFSSVWNVLRAPLNPLLSLSYPHSAACCFKAFKIRNLQKYSLDKQVLKNVLFYHHWDGILLCCFSTESLTVIFTSRAPAELHFLTWSLSHVYQIE